MNDVLKEQEPAFFKLTDSAEALLQAMEGLVMILDVQGKVLDSNCSSVTEIHPLHRRWIDSGMGKDFPGNLRNQLVQGIQKTISTKTTELIRFSLNDTSPEVSHEYRIVPHSSKTALCLVREIDDEINPDERKEKFNSDYQALLNALAELVFRTTRDGVIKEFFIPQGWEIGLKRKIQKGKTLWHYFPEPIQKLWIQDWNEKIRLLEEGDLIQSFDYELPYASVSKHFEARLVLFGEEEVLVTVRETTPMVRAFQQLENSENRYRAFLESHPDIIFRMNLDGYYLDIHASDESQLVKPREEFLGQRIHDTHPPENVEMFEASVKKLLRTGEIQFEHYSLEVQSGLEHFERRMLRSGPNEILMIISNVSRRVEQQKQLEEQSQRRKALLNANPDLVFRMKFYGTILEAHTSDPDLLIEKADLSTTEGKNMKDLAPPWLFSKWEKSRDAYLKTGKTQSYEYELITKKGLSFFEARVTGCGEDEFYVVIRDITTRKKAEQKLIASEERYRTLVESLPDITVRTDFEGYYLDYHIAENLFIAEKIRDKFSNHQQLGKQLWSVLDQKIHKSLLHRWRKIRDRSYQNQTVETFEYSLPGEKGEVFLNMRIKALPNREVVMHIRDVSERRKMILEIQNNEKRFRQMVEKLPVPVSITRLDNHEILYVNPKGYEIYGMDPKVSGFTGKKASDFYINPEERLRLVDEIKKQGFVEPIEREFIRPDGTRFWGMHSAIKIEFEGFQANLATMVDTTELRQARGQLMEKSRLAGLGQLSAGLAHELNTPLASMTLILENLNEALPEDLIQEFPKSTELIQSQLNRISEIVKQMLQFGREPIKKRITILDLRTVVQTVLILAEGTFKQQKIRFSKNLHRSPVRVRASRWQMEHVLHNLLNNACYALRGMPDPEIQLKLEKRDGQAFLEVRDNGCGIAEQDLPKLKDPFFTTKPPGEGTGLGLSVCHGYLEEHGGELEISSPGQGRGASFRFLLPLEKAPSRSVSSNKSPAN